MKLSPTHSLSLLCCLGFLAAANPAAAQCANTEVQTLSPFDAAAGDHNGTGVAVEGYLAAVGSPGDESGTGSVYVYQHDGFNWRLQGKLTAVAGARGDRFGTSVSISGDVIVVGAYQPSPANAPGVAYVFEKPATGWGDMTETAVLSASDGMPDDNFGYSVDIHSNTIAIGAYLDDDGGSNAGTAFVFERPGSSWVNMTETGKLTASDANTLDQFGISVSIHGDQIAVGADRDSDVIVQGGSAYLFEQPVGGWGTMTETAKLTLAAPVDFDRFGLSVATTNGTVVVGAWGDDTVAQKAGAAYVFNEPAGGWAHMNETARLTASNGVAGDHFGWAVDIDSDVILVGAPANLFDGSGMGSAYSFLRPAGGWVSATENNILTQSNRAVDDDFGYKVALSQPLGLVGARYFETQGFSNAGAAYLFGSNMDCDNNGVLDQCDINAGNGTDANRDGRMDSCGTQVTFCDPADVNSTGVPTELSSSAAPGAGLAAHLEATSGPANQFGYFLVGSGVSDPGVPLSQGHLC
ncbi:MAG: FG-GAP repeat protein, partial [Planctomycetota bacterium]|nr:FG-GAP repeat protein [Planctomycetota bacterium]